MKRVALIFPSLLRSYILTPSVCYCATALGQLNQQFMHHAVFMAQGSHKYSGTCLQRFSTPHTLQQHNFLTQETGSKQRGGTSSATSQQPLAQP